MARFVGRVPARVCVLRCVRVTFTGSACVEERVCVRGIRSRTTGLGKAVCVCACAHPGRQFLQPRYEQLTWNWR